jgi:hypothetical protein
MKKIISNTFICCMGLCWSLAVAGGFSAPPSLTQSIADARYAQLMGLNTQAFSVANAIGAQNALPLGQEDARYVFSGVDGNTFNVINLLANATLLQSQSGKRIIPAGSTNTVTLPTSPAIGTNYIIEGNGVFIITVAGGGGNVFQMPDDTNPATYALPSKYGASIYVIWTSGGWRASLVGRPIVANAINNNEALALGQISGGSINAAFNSVNLGGTVYLAGVKLMSSTAPTIFSQFGTGATILHANGTASFQINVGTGGTSSSGAITLPVAPNGWNCLPINQLGVGVARQDNNPLPTLAQFSNRDPATGNLVAWTSGATMLVSCFAY